MVQNEKPTGKEVNTPTASAGTSATETPVYTTSQVDKMIKDALSARGRELKPFTERIADLEARLEAKDEEDFRDDPERLAQHRKGKETAKTIEQLRRDVAAANEAINELRQGKKETISSEKTELIETTAKTVTKETEAVPKVLHTDSGKSAGTVGLIQSLSPLERIKERDRRIRDGKIKED